MSAVACQKCGSGDGWDGPVYRKPVLLDVSGARVVPRYLQQHPDGLIFTCRMCGYERVEACRDAKPISKVDDQ